MGGEVGCMLSEGPWIFVGITNAVKAWNTQTGTELSLDGPAGQVYALVVGIEMLFTGIQDGRILAWKSGAMGNSFEPAASLIGHHRAVVSLVSAAGRLYSGFMDNTIRGVLALCGMTDAQAKPVLFCSLNDNSVRLYYDLPPFSERGKIFAEEIRSIQMGPGGLFFTGDGTCEPKVWK